MDFLTVVLDRPLGDITLMDVQQASDRSKRCRLTCTVRTKKCNDLSFSHFEGQTPKNQDDIVVYDFEVRYLKHDCFFLSFSSQRGSLGVRLPAPPKLRRLGYSS